MNKITRHFKITLIEETCMYIILLVCILVYKHM